MLPPPFSANLPSQIRGLILSRRDKRVAGESERLANRHFQAMQPRTSKQSSGFLAVVFLLATHASAQTVIFTDNFNVGPSPLWNNLRGDWVASNGVYFAELPSNNPLTYSAVPFTLTDCTLDVDINGVGDGGVWLHSDAAGQNGILLVTGGNGYGSGVRGGGAGTSLYWHRVVNNVYSGAMGEAYNVFTYPGIQNVQIKVRVSGDVYSAFVNGSTNAATSFTDGTYSSGRVALYDFSSQTFGNLVIQVPTQPPGPFALAITNSGLNQASLFWPTNANGFFLESTPSLASPVWMPLTNQPMIAGGQFTVPVAITNARQFFRLSAR
jgi:hypothetical protein